MYNKLRKTKRKTICSSSRNKRLKSGFVWEILSELGSIKMKALFPPGKETSWRRRSDVSRYVPMTSQWRLKWNTQRRLSGTSPRRLTGRSPRCHRGTSWRRLKDTSLGSHIGTSLRRPKPVLNETPNDVSVVRRQDVSLVRLHDVIEELHDDIWRIRR